MRIGWIVASLTPLRRVLRPSPLTGVGAAAKPPRPLSLLSKRTRKQKSGYILPRRCHILARTLKANQSWVWNPPF